MRRGGVVCEGGRGGLGVAGWCGTRCTAGVITVSRIDHQDEGEDDVIDEDDDD